MAHTTPTQESIAAGFDFLAAGIRTMETERDAIAELILRQKQQREGFTTACELMLACRGRVVVTGMGKSGHIGNKIAATLASTGTPSFFVHPGEASHGDLGMITKDDVVIAISNSGNTAEIISILPLIKRMSIPLITLTGNARSQMAALADVNLDTSVSKEACPLGLAPTSSTTVTLVLGDALAVALLEAKGFSEEDFAFSHPGGALGRRLLLKVADIMHDGPRIPAVSESASMSDCLLEMTRQGLGMACIVDSEFRLLGIFTDGDLRRALESRVDIHKAHLADIMTVKCTTIAADMLAAKALAIMDEKKINALPVVADDRKLIGALNMHDLLRAGVV
ncbi:KpsF/GutQ family sugar-phosphate isomerase [Allohahella sp. A8]|uniref:KpsF/GutQ family sugar-phosphate isomerase n=1 Tax=Allohahella sp. A8 TaxID=3141461 RepID=UPI000C0BB772|nr:D-arabinose 5-phosphate isomerase [Hahellaceae bacterium]|tara:strand:- start:60260 stop:61273 length:1014 start_codon:yes stop_codon:yes gene_type:complete